MGMTGAGGYGGSSTMNTDQRGPRYGPHKLISTFQDLMLDVTNVKCLKCDKNWTHKRGAREWPKNC